MTPNQALELAAQAWQTEETRDVQMDESLADAFANILLREVNKGGPVCRLEGEPGELWLHHKDGGQIPFSEAAAQTISDVLKAYTPEHGPQKRVEQFQFCIDRVAEALGNVCCGGVDSSPEDQMADPHSTTRVLVDAIAKLQKANAQEIITIGFDKNGEWDFGVSCSVCELTLSQMNRLRAMVVVAVGTMEQMWRDEYMKKPENMGQSAVEDGDWKSRPDGGPA